MDVSREDHIKFCKAEAYHCYEFHRSGHKYSEPDKAIQHACTTMLCDLSKHPETENVARNLVMMVWIVKTESEMRRFIDGVN